MNNYDWDLIYVLPNIEMKEPFESEFMAIVPFDDKRLKKIRSDSQPKKKLLIGFRTVTGEKVKPSALIWRKDAPKSVKRGEAVVAFRNSLAISSLLYNCAISANSNNLYGPIFSDHFDFSPVTITPGGGFHISSPALEVYGPKLEKFLGLIPPHIPYDHFLQTKPDKFLSKKIIDKWTERVVSPAQDSWDTRILFRSLEVAYQAMVTPFRNNSSLFEYGTNLALWISAFEILFHKNSGDLVNRKIVFNRLGGYRWKEKRLRHKRFTLDKKNKNITKGNLVQKLYKELYDARCDFLHGNPVRIARLYPFFNKNRPSLFVLAPVIYWTALTVFLSEENDSGHDIDIKKAILKSMNDSAYEEALLSSIGVSIEGTYEENSLEKKA